MAAVTLSLPVYRKLAHSIQLSKVGQLGAGDLGGAYSDVDIYVQKGRGAQYGEGGFYTTLAKMLVKGVKALAPHMKSAAKAGLSAGKAAAKELAKKKAGELVSQAAGELLGAGHESAHKKLAGGHCRQQCGQGMRLSSGQGMTVGMGMRIGSGMRVSQ